MQVDSYPVGWVHKIPSKRPRTSRGTQKESSKKRSRRTAAEIERKHKCMYAGCRKSYGSDGALKMHIKLKHAPQKNSASHGVCYGAGTLPAVNIHYPPPHVTLPLPTPAGFDPSSWLLELPEEELAPPPNLELDQVLAHEPSHSEEEGSSSPSSDVPSSPALSLSTNHEVEISEELATMDHFDLAEIVNEPGLADTEAFGPCGSIYFALTNAPSAAPPSLFALRNIRIGCWCQFSQATVDLSLQVDCERNSLLYYIEDCSLPLHSLEMSTSLKIEFHLDSVREYCLESHGDYLHLVLSLQFSPCFYSCSVPRGHMFDPNTIRWSPAQDFTQNQATEHRYHVLKIMKGDDRTEARLKSLFAACKIRYNAQAALLLDNGTVFQMKNQLSKYESLLLDQRFKRTPTSFRGDQPLFRVHHTASSSSSRGKGRADHSSVQSPFSPALSFHPSPAMDPFYYPSPSSSSSFGSDPLEILS